MPDPQDVETFLRSKLEPREPDPLYRELLELRRDAAARARDVEADEDAKRLHVRRGEVELVRDFRARTRRRCAADGRLARPPVSARRDLGRRAARTSRSSRRTPSASSSASSTTQARRTRIELARAHRVQLARLRPGRRARPALRRTASTAVGAGATATGSTRSKLLLDPYAKAIDGAGRLATAANTLPYVPSGETTPTSRSTTTRRRGRDAEVRRDRPELRLGGRRRSAARPVARDGHLRGARQGLHEAPSGRARGSARHVRAASRPSAAIEHLKSLGVTAVELLPGPPHRRRGVPPRPRPDELLGLLVDRLPRAARALLGDRPPRRAGARVQGNGEGAAPRGHRGDPRRRLQPHRRGQPPRARCSRFKGDRQRGATTG